MDYYYILHEDTKIGPYDLVSMIHRIRQNLLSPESQIMVMGKEDEPPITAAEIPELAEVFNEERSEVQPDQATEHSFLLVPVIRQCWNLMIDNPMVLYFAGVILLLCGLLMLLASRIPVLGVVIGAAVTGILFAAYALIVQRVHRAQAIDYDGIFQKIRSHIKPVTLGGLLTILPPAAGIMLMNDENTILMVLGLLVALGGLLSFTAFAFLPFLIMNRNMALGDAIQTCISVMKQNENTFATLLGLAVLNFVGALLILPLFITVPLWFMAVSYTYEELFLRK